MTTRKKQDGQLFQKLCDFFVDAIQMIITHDPLKPSDETATNSAQIKRQRDEHTIIKILKNIHTDTVLQMVQELPLTLRGRTIHFFEGVNAIVQDPAFHIYSSELESIVKRLYVAWDECVSHGHQYTNIQEPDTYKFINPNGLPLSPEQKAIWRSIDKAASDFNSAHRDFLKYVRKNFPMVDIDALNAEAWNVYKDFISD